MQLSRRDLLKVGLFSSAALMLPAERIARTQLAIANRIPQSQLPEPFTMDFKIPPRAQPVGQAGLTDYYVLRQEQRKVNILPDRQTTIWGYNGATPGPTIYASQGRNAVVRQICALPDTHPTLGYNVWTSTHLHGSCSLPQYDGYASDTTTPGAFKDYHYPNIQDARTLWYHDHGVHITANNAYMGLAAMYVLHDPKALALPIPRGERYDVPLILKDAMFQSNGDLVFDDNNESGIYGDVILVNGVPWPKMKVEPRKYRFRVLNASVSRSYDLALDTGDPLTVIGTDGGLMPQSQDCAHVKVGMAERYEIVIDFAKYKPGQQVVLKNLGPKNNIDYDTTGVIMAFEVGAVVTDSRYNEVPKDLNDNMRVMGLTEADVSKDERGQPIVRNMRFERKNSHWTVNGQTWEDVVNADYDLTVANPKYGDVEIWELENPGGGWFHPVHIHLVDFKVLDRNGKAPEAYEKGPKDVVYVGESEKVRVIMRFENQRGKYMMHCHNLVHEDHDMMVQFEVGDGGDDPIHADPCKDQGEMGDLVPHEDDHGHGSPGGSTTISVPAAPAPAPAATPPAPQVKVLGSKVKHKAKRKVKVKHKAKRKVTPKTKHKTKTHAKPGAKKSPSRKRLASRRGRS
jgi:FtsP/CotA-like multicopper oxidase with cupredoxin domain